MLDNKAKNQETELVKLVSFAYDLHSDGLKYYGSDCDLFPRVYTYNHYSYETKRLEKGIVFGKRGYSNHSTGTVFTNLGLTVGTIENGKLNMEYAIMFDIVNNKNYVTTSLLERVDDKTYEPELGYKFGWHNLTEEERINLFVKSMVILGFREQDVKDVVNGKMSAREAYMNIAQEEKKYMQWVDVGRHYYEFYNNVAVSGYFGTVDSFDKFPFPFEGEVVIDCSKCKTSFIKLKDNTRKVRLINVNQNRDSIKYANLRNAIIDEVIDLSMVDADDTVFGHHKVTNIEYSIAKVNDMDLSLACDQDGNRFKVDKNGKAEVNCFGEATILEDKKENKEIQVLSNVDNEEMIEQTLNTGDTSIGLVRTETLFYDKEKIEKYLPLFLDYDNDEDLLKEFKDEQSRLLDFIFRNFKDKRVVVRLFDFRFSDILKLVKITQEDLDEVYSMYDMERLMEIRGAHFLYQNEELLRAQLEAIFRMCTKYNREVDILVPYVESEYSLVNARGIAKEVNEDIGAQFRIGAMVENKYSTNRADILAKFSDFISIGLNDLTESVLGKSRDSENTEFYYLSEEVKEVVKEAIYRIKVGNPDIQIGICGEHVNYLENLDFFRDLDIDYVSVNPSNIMMIRERINKSVGEYSLRLVRPTNNNETK